MVLFDPAVSMERQLSYYVPLDILREQGRGHMGLLGSLKSLFGGGGSEGEAAPADQVEYQGFQIQPAPERREGGWNTAGLITKTIDGEEKEHRFIRVDTHSNRDDAISFSITKAQQIINEQGDHLFKSKR